MYMAVRHYGTILERQLDLKRERIAESARLVWDLPLKSRPRRLRTRADSRLGDSEGNERLKVTGTARAPGARGFPEPRAPRPSPPLPAQPPPPLPTRLPQVSTNGNGSHSAGDQRKQNTEAAAGGLLWGRRPRNDAGLRGPALPSSPTAALTRSESTLLPPPALQSPLRTAATRAPRAASLPVKRAAPATRSVRPLGPSRGISAETPNPPPACQAPPVSRLQLPAGCAI